MLSCIITEHVKNIMRQELYIVLSLSDLSLTSLEDINNY